MNKDVNDAIVKTVKCKNICFLVDFFFNINCEVDTDATVYITLGIKSCKIKIHIFSIICSPLSKKCVIIT